MRIAGIGAWDIALLLAASLQATVLAYLRQPRLKALALTLPIPFTMAAMALGRPVDATNVAGMTLLLGFAHAVRLLHQERRVPIVPSIAIAVCGYCVAAWALAKSLPVTDIGFYTACAITLSVGLAMYIRMPHRHEPEHRSPMPVWLKLPAVAFVILALITIKHTLGGFTTTFPMVGVVAAYEARHSLWTISRQIPVMMMTTVPFTIICRLTQGTYGLGISLLAAWAVFLVILVPLTKRMWQTGEAGIAD